MILVLRFLMYALVAGIASFALYIPVKILAHRSNWLDHPNERKIHSRPVPRIGGVMIFGAFVITLIIAFATNPGLQIILPKTFNLTAVLIFAGAAFVLGIIDDVKGVPVLRKLTIQFAIGFAIAFSGLLIDKFTIFGQIIPFGWLSYPITALWVVAIINAVNLIDGMDGLASGIMIIALGFTFVISVVEANYLVTFLSAILMGSIAGFYVFNFPPARIFMGDGGSYFIGCMYAMMAMMNMKKTSMAIMFALPLVLLMIPIADVIYTSIRRKKRHTSVFNADKNHIHHRLLSLGFNVVQINFLIYLVCVSFGLIALLIALTGGKYGLIYFILVLCLTIAGFGVIRILEKKNS